MPTALQLKLVHVAARQAGLNDAQYRTLLRSVAEVESSRQLAQADFEDVMAVLEDLGFVDSKNGAGYWRRKVEQRGRRGNERMVHKINELCQGGQGGRYPLESMVRRFSGDRTADVEQLTPREAWKLIECLKAIVARDGGDESPAKDRPQGRGRGHEARNLFSLP